MEKRILGRTGIEVTELCLGTLPYGPLQKNLLIEEVVKIVSMGLRAGINFVDTAQTYGTYESIRLAIKETGIRPVIASKSPAIAYEDMRNAVYEALEKLDIKYIDIFLLHAARAETDVFDKRAGAWQCLQELKAKGVIKAIGIATHNPSVVEVAANREDVDVVFPIINKEGKGIYNGTREDMTVSISRAFEANKGIYFMKALGGGNLINDYQECMDYVRNIKGYASIAIGMVSENEVLYNVSYFDGITDAQKLPIIDKDSKYYSVLSHICKGCGECTLVCHSNALRINENGKAQIDLEKCVYCGYCTDACPLYAIRFI